MLYSFYIFSDTFPFFYIKSPCMWNPAPLSSENLAICICRSSVSLQFTHNMMSPAIPSSLNKTLLLQLLSTDKGSSTGRHYSPTYFCPELLIITNAMLHLLHSCLQIQSPSVTNFETTLCVWHKLWSFCHNL